MDKPINCLIYIELFCFRQRKDMIHSWVMENTGFWQPFIKLNEAIIMDDSELFKLKLSREEHVSVLKTALKLSTFSDPDICLVSREGFKVFTHRWCKNTIDKNWCLSRWWSLIDSVLSPRSLLCLHSPLLSSLLCEAGDSCCCTQDGISVPATAASLHTLIQLLVEGSARLWEHKVREKFMIQGFEAPEKWLLNMLFQW